MAEINLVEVVSSMVNNLLDEIRLFYNNIELLGTENGAKVTAKVRELKERVEELKDQAMEYVAKLEYGLIAKDVFAPMIIDLNNVAQLIDGASHYLNKAFERCPNESARELVKDMLDKLLHQSHNMREAARLVLTNPKLSMEYAKRASKIEDEVDRIFRDGIMKALETKDCVSAIITWSAISNLEDASDLLKDIADNMRYFALHKV